MPEKRSDKQNTRSKKLTRKETRELDIKISFLEGLVRRDPAYIEALQLLGDHYTERGLLESGLQVDLKLSTLLPSNPVVFYNLACSYSLVGDFDLAAASLESALTLGYRDFNWLARDPDLRKLRKHPLFQPIRDKIRKMKIKVA